MHFELALAFKDKQPSRSEWRGKLKPVSLSTGGSSEQMPRDGVFYIELDWLIMLCENLAKQSQCEKRATVGDSYPLLPSFSPSLLHTYLVRAPCGVFYADVEIILADIALLLDLITTS
jgi:hypothetical protein